MFSGPTEDGPFIVPVRSFSSRAATRGEQPPAREYPSHMTFVHPATLRRGLSVAVLCCAAGCASTRAPASPASMSPPTTAPGHTIEVAPVVVSPYDDVELAAQFEHGRTLLLAEKYAEAAEIFDRLVRLAPSSEVAPPSLYDGAIAHEGMNERDGAIARLLELLQRYPAHATARGALFRLGRLYGYLERWGDLVRISDRALARSDLTVLEAIEAHGGKALGLVEQDDLDQAGHEVGLAWDLIEQHRIGEAGRPPIELAEVSFSLGEIRRRKSERITFVPVPLNLAEVIEQRCQGLLDAQNAYTEAMRSFDAHWSAMAGYRVGQLYQQLHRDVMQIPPPAKADTLKKKQLFEGAMRLRYRVLLEKGLALMDGTVRLGARTGEESVWVSRARDAKRDLDLALEDEKAALSKLPFTEAELTAALEQLKKPAP
jgi:tetratricopeptide (TPR) repeat protein